MKKEFIFAGFGGQGMLLIGKFLAMALRSMVPVSAKVLKSHGTEAMILIPSMLSHSMLTGSLTSQT